ncbi:outer membrane protein assembly factor BamE [Agitococcus lubricus]|uniref:Outer membrane protein assembly factor BamE n=1 Tax=Agitococcus lubricus TaxID=1077255 RepID=A0A2T5J3G6_9GAMM|nr:outer membrane protein assembly factor BamE [Agitococcus lubricus]PTQ91141.1 Beta-barrel assembly machine subunit BamE [Agitococcus lubricus]
MTQKLFFLPILLATLVSLTACQALSVYKIDRPQGNPITQDMAAKLKLGMTPSQVRYILGSPMITDTLNPNRWDYQYRFDAGTYAKYNGIKDVRHQGLSVIFEQGKLSQIIGADTLPTNTTMTIPSKDGGLRAEPL